ncbi:MAG: histidine kinase, partial [Blautia sp.]|nr:histidine kinase [Blautia sp.]
MRRWFRNLTLSRKILLSFSVVLLLNALLCGAAYYSYAGNATVKNYKNSASDLVGQMCIHLNDRFSGLTMRVNALSSNLSFAVPMRTYLSGEDGTDAVLAGNVADMITEIRMTDDLISSMYIVTEKAQFDDYTLTRKWESDFYDTVMYRYFQEHTDETIAWFPAMENPVYQEQGEVIPVVYRKQIGRDNVYFVVDLSQTALDDYLGHAYVSFYRVFLTDASGNNILGYTEDDKTVTETFAQTEREDVACQEVTWAKEAYLVTNARLESNGWEIYAMISKSGLVGSLRQARRFVILVSLIAGVICMGFLLLVSEQLTASLKRLAQSMRTAGQEEYHTEFSYLYRDEVGQLAQSFNGMLGQIRAHIHALEEEKERVKEIQRQKRKVELQALQAQINPHFLYNTLNMITWQAVDQGAEEISVISNALGKYFRVSLSKGREIITLAEELEHVRSYLEIQKIRYSTKLNYEILVDPELTERKVIKLILQPLVENALYHGIKVKEGKG